MQVNHFLGPICHLPYLNHSPLTDLYRLVICQSCPDLCEFITCLVGLLAIFRFLLPRRPTLISSFLHRITSLFFPTLSIFHCSLCCRYCAVLSPRSLITSFSISCCFISDLTYYPGCKPDSSTVLPECTEAPSPL